MAPPLSLATLALNFDPVTVKSEEASALIAPP